jgi:hypothetical protein
MSNLVRCARLTVVLRSLTQRAYVVCRSALSHKNHYFGRPCNLAVVRVAQESRHECDGALFPNREALGAEEVRGAAAQKSALGQQAWRGRRSDQVEWMGCVSDRLGCLAVRAQEASAHTLPVTKPIAACDGLYWQPSLLEH